MKMTKIRLMGSKTVDLPLLGADPSGPFVLKSAEGLGPPDVGVRLVRTVLERAIYQGKSAALRQIVLLVGLQPDWDVGQTAEQLRTDLYLLLTPKYGQMLSVRIMDGETTQGFAQGHISKLEAAMFTKDPAVQITIDCDYPYFLAPDSVAQEPAQRTVSGMRAFDINNPGTAPSGFKLGLILRANVGNMLYLFDEHPSGQKFQIDGINWQSGDRFVLDTRPGSRGVWRGAGGGALVSVLNNMNATVSEWIQLHGGDNTLLLNASAFDWDPTFKFVHQPAFWGV